MNYECDVYWWHLNSILKTKWNLAIAFHFFWPQSVMSGVGITRQKWPMFCKRNAFSWPKYSCFNSNVTEVCFSRYNWKYGIRCWALAWLEYVQYWVHWHIWIRSTVSGEKIIIVLNKLNMRFPRCHCLKHTYIKMSILYREPTLSILCTRLEIHWRIYAALGRDEVNAWQARQYIWLISRLWGKACESMEFHHDVIGKWRGAYSATWFSPEDSFRYVMKIANLKFHHHTWKVSSI